MLNIYATLIKLTIEDAREFIVSKVNVCDLQQLQGFAEFDGNSDLAYTLWDVRT